MVCRRAGTSRCLSCHDDNTPMTPKQMAICRLCIAVMGEAIFDYRPDLAAFQT